MSAKPYTATDLAGLREVAAVVKPSDTSLTARMMATIDTVAAERDELREAARAMVEAAADMAPHCPRCRERVAVTKRCPGPRGGAWFSCDEHATADAMDLNHAPALRRLRALVEVKL